MDASGLPLRVTWLLDGLELNGAPDASGREWFLTGESGWSGSAPPRTTRAPRLWADGSSRGRAYKDERLIRLDGTVACPSWESRRQAEHKLASLCGSSDLYTLVCFEETGGWQTAVELDDAVLVGIVPGGYDLDFTIQLAAPDPYRYSVSELQSETTLPSSTGGGLTFEGAEFSGANFTPAGFSGVDFGEPDPSGSVFITNDGNAPAPLVLELTGPLQPPIRVWRPDTGQALVYQGVVSSNQTLRLDTGRRTAYVGDANQRHLLAQADWFHVPVGTTRIMWEHTGLFNGQARLNVRWRHTRF